MRTSRALALVGLVLALAPLAVAQSAPVVIDRVDVGERLSADVGAPASAAFRLFNLDPAEDTFVRVVVAGPDGWSSRVAAPELGEGAGFFLGPRANVTVVVDLTPVDSARTGVFEIVFEFVDPSSGTLTRAAHEVEVDSRIPPKVFSAWRNPLPPPLDNAYGTFGLEMAFWGLIGLASIFGSDTLVRLVTARASSEVTREIIAKLRRPVFYFVLFLGLSHSFTLLPRNAVTVFLAKTFLAVGVAIFGLYVAYRALDAALLYYQVEVAPRTKNQIDDVLVPLLRKVGIVILYVVGILMTLRELGWDPTIVFAGAGIAGLVIAFAAQDTFSNLFSGVFLLLDRPFQEGDDIQLETGEIARVQNVGLRTTRLYNPRTHETIVVPNTQLATRRIINLAGPDHRYWVQINVGAAYGTDPRRVEAILEEVGRANPMTLKDKGWEPNAFFVNFGESSLDFMLRCAIANFRDRTEVASQLRHQISEAFARERIEIPFPQRTLWLRQEGGADPARVEVRPRRDP